MELYRNELISRFRDRFNRLYGDQTDLCLERMRMLVGRYGVGLNPDRPHERWNQASSLLITYADMVQCKGDEVPLKTLKSFCDRHLRGAFEYVHVLPFCPYSSDDGFSVIDYREVNPDFGSWHDIEKLGENFKLMFDLVLNHCSRKSDWFKQFLNGIMPGRDYFVTEKPTTDLSQVVRPRTHPLLTKFPTRDGDEYVWTTFSADQVDLDFSNPDVLFEFLDILLWYISKGARMIRLDAIAYLWKEAGTGCIHLPQTHEAVKLFRDFLEMVAPDVLILTETNVPHEENISYFGDGDEANVIYQFSLPPLLLHTLLSGDSGKLSEWASSLGRLPDGCTYLNFTASHDGIGVRPLEGLVPQEQILELAEKVRERGGKVNCKTNPDGTESPYELNITYFSALCDDPEKPSPIDAQRFLCSQAIALSLQGIPAVYFHSLTGTRNWDEGVRTLGYNRAINRMKWDDEALEALLQDGENETAAVFEPYLQMLRVRAGHPAFHPGGSQTVLDISEKFFALERTAPGGGEVIIAISNVTAEELPLHLAEQLPVFATRKDAEHLDALAGESFKGEKIIFAPYQTRWIVVSQE